MKKLVAIYTTTAIVLANTLILFVVLNLLIMTVITPAEKTRLESYYYSFDEFAEQKEEELLKIYDYKKKEDILRLVRENPTVRSHPVLEFVTAPKRTENYHIGAENCRYHDGVNDTTFQRLVHKSVWVFGGSTTFGFGVGNNETIPYFLDSLDSTNSYLNFGALSYHQKNEIEKLILLLQKGYRPSSVVFIDGLNDLYKLAESNLNVHETPSRFANAYANDFSFGSLGYKTGLIYSLPVVKLFFQYQANNLINKGVITAESLSQTNHDKALYYTNPILHYYANEILINKAQDTLNLSHKVMKYYRSNIQLLDALSKAYQFEYTIFLQPLGTLYSANPFIKDLPTFRNNYRLYKNIEPVYRALLHEVKQQKLPHFYDLSFAHHLVAHPYVDLTHYSISMNRSMATLILNQIRYQQKHEGIRVD